MLRVCTESMFLSGASCVSGQYREVDANTYLSYCVDRVSHSGICAQSPSGYSSFVGRGIRHTYVGNLHTRTFDDRHLHLHSFTIGRIVTTSNSMHAYVTEIQVIRDFGYVSYLELLMGTSRGSKESTFQGCGYYQDTGQYNDYLGYVFSTYSLSP